MPTSERNLLRTSLLGAITGLLAGIVVLGFRWLLDSGQVAILPGGEIGNYEALDPRVRLLLPVLSGLLLGLLFERLPRDYRSVGVVHVLANLRLSGGRPLPLKNALVQFFGGAAAIVCGHSVDREGPGVHLGAAVGSRVGQYRESSPQDNYTLIACGAAAGIAAAFNTPLAGAVFVIEVLRVRYTISRFMPIILAAVMGAVVTRYVHGHNAIYSVSGLSINSLLELPLLALLGIATGLLAALFITLCETVARRSGHLRPSHAFTLAGICTGILGLWVPQIMGVGYDTLNAMLNGGFGLSVLLGIVAFKLLATGISIGLRIPGGLIGPTLVIGGAAGSLLGLGAAALPFAAGSLGFYALIGMVAMMGASMQAPLAALIALLELTGRPDIILPGMLAVVSADLVVVCCA